MNLPLLNLEIRLEVDIVLARQRARQIAALLGFAPLDQTRIATATSEIARNAVKYAGGARLEFIVESGPAPAMMMRIRERGPGIPDLQAILDGEYESSSGLGLGIIGAKRLMDRFDIESTPGAGSSVVMAKNLPADARRASRPRRLGASRQSWPGPHSRGCWTSFNSRTRNCSARCKSCAAASLKSPRCTAGSLTRRIVGSWRSMPSSMKAPRHCSASPI